MNDSTSTLHLPRILCLHGGGVNGEVFGLQCRGIISRLRPYFRLVFVDGPFSSHPHEKIVAVYGEMGPFYRWVPWLSNHDGLDDETTAERIVDVCQAAMRRDTATAGATGPWVGLLGFSQGAKIAASLLWAQEQALKVGLEPLTSFRFAVLMAGSPPVLRLDMRLPEVRHVAPCGENTLHYKDLPEEGPVGEHVISTPTLHVLGLQDPDVNYHRRLLRDYCQPGTTRKVEWDGDHRLPIKTPDVTAVVNQILDIADELDIM